MNNHPDNSETRTINATFEAFISNELLPQIGLTRPAFNKLLDQLGAATSGDGLSADLFTGPNLQQTDRVDQDIQWGSLYSALYQENAIPHCAGLRAGQKNNPARTRRVTSSIKDYLDIAFPLTEGSHHDVTSYMVYFQNLMMILADGSTAGLQNPAQFVAKIGPRDNPESILLLQNGQHVELTFDTCGDIGSTDLAGINDVQVEIVKSTRSDLEAKSVEAKIDRYRELMHLASSKSNGEATLANCDNTDFTAKNGDAYKASNTGHIVYINASNSIDSLAANQSQALSTSSVDTLIATLIAGCANRLRHTDSFYAGPRITVVSDNTALTLHMLHSVDKAYRQSRVSTRTRLSVIKNCETVYQHNTTENNRLADTRAERETLNDQGQTVTQKHSPVNNNEKVTNAEANSINQAVLTAMHQHGFELARLSRGLPGDSFGDQNQLPTRAFA